MDKYNEVVVKEQIEDVVEIQPQYVYLTIPADWICVYHKLLVAVADFGKKILDDCNSTCKGTNKTIINCWNIFQSAVACKELDDEDKANFFINYINKQLNNIYKGTNNDVYDGVFKATISNDGKLQAMVTCGINIKFEVDTETGILYKKYIEGKDNNKVFTIEDNNLTVKQ